MPGALAEQGGQGLEVRCLRPTVEPRSWAQSPGAESGDLARGLGKGHLSDLLCRTELPLHTRPEGFDDGSLQGPRELPPHSHTPL